MKDYKITFKLEDKEYPAIFNLNVMEAIQEEYGTVSKWAELTDGSTGEPNAKALIFGYTAMINEAIDIENDEKGTKSPLLTKKQVGRLITRVGLQSSAETLNKAIVEATKSEEKN